MSRFTTEGKHIPPELLPKVQELGVRYTYADHIQPGSANARLIEELGLVDEAALPRGLGDAGGARLPVALPCGFGELKPGLNAAGHVLKKGASPRARLTASRSAQAISINPSPIVTRAAIHGLLFWLGVRLLSRLEPACW